MFLERHPGERRRIEDIATRRAIETSGHPEKSATANKAQDLEDESRLYNELEITIVKASGLPASSDKEPPSSYVHIQLLGHPDKFTNPRPYDANPVFNEKFIFPMITTEQQLRLLRRSQLLLSVIDMKAEELDESEGDGVLGELSVALGEVADGNSVASTFSVKDKESRHVADLEIAIRWKSPLKKQRELGPLALSALDVERIISCFGSKSTELMTVDYVEFCRFIDPPQSVSRSREALHAFITGVADKEGRLPKDVLKALFYDSKKIAEEEFVSILLKLNCDILPAELTDLFKHIDRDKAEFISVDEIQSELGLDDVVRLPPVLNVKLRHRVKELAVKKQYPLKYFEEADSWGERGHLSRLEFKKVLRRLGFHLVDEPMLAEDEGPAARTVIKEEASHANENLNEEVLVAKQGDVSAYLKEQRELFERKLADLQIHSQHVLDEAIRNKKGRVEGKSESSADRKEVAIGANLLQVPGDIDPFASTAEHVSGVGNIAKEAAFLLREAARNTVPSEVPKPKVTASKKLHRQVDIVSAESALIQALSTFEGVSKAPDFIRAFIKVDNDRKGFVNKKQFAHVVKQMEGVSLKPDELSAFMQFFDSDDGEGDAKIDYNAFVRMSRYQPPANVPSLPLQSIVLSIERIEFIRSMDTTGARVLRRSDILRAFGDMGYKMSSLSNAIVLFETQTVGRVNYENLIEYILENSMCSAYDKLLTEFKDTVLEETGGNQELIRKWFTYICSHREDSFTFDEFQNFLGQRGYSSSKEISGCLFGAMDKDRKGSVSFKDFYSWAMRNAPKVSDLAFASLSIQELRKKAELYTKALHDAGISPDGMTESYNVYDWRTPPLKAIDSLQFINATRRLGFPFIGNEMRMLCSEFSSGTKDRVDYGKFLEWSIPRGGDDHEILQKTEGRRLGGSSIAAFLEKAARQGVDLMSCFGRYDAKNIGRITISEFCAALADIGLSSTTLDDAHAFCERSKALSGDFVLYRRVMTELLRQLDDHTGAEDVDIIDILHAGMQRNKVSLNKLVEVFEHYDRKGQGRIRIDDVGTVFEDAGVFLRRKELKLILERFSIGDSQLIQYSSIVSALEDRLGALTNRRVDQPLPEDLAAKVRRALESLIIKGIDFRKEFDALDSSFEGSLPKNDFKAVLRTRLKMDLNDSEIGTLMDTYISLDDNRRVNFVKFLSELHPTSSSRQSIEYFNEVGLFESAEDLRRLIRRRFPEYAFPGELKRPWRHFAGKSGAKEVGLREFSAGLQKLGMQLSPEVETALLRLMCLDDAPLTNQACIYPEFLIFVRDPHHRDVVWKFRRMVARSGSSERDILSAFREQDSNDSGVITLKQFEKALAACNIHLSESDAARLFARFDEEDTCALSIKSFLRFVRGERRDHIDGQSPFPSKSLEAPGNVISPGNDLLAWSSLKERVEDKFISGFTASEIYSIFSNDGGSIDLASLHHGARELGLLHLTRAEIRSVLRRMCMAVGAVLDADSFFRALGIDTRGMRKVPAGKVQAEKSQHEDVTRLLVSIRKDIEAGHRGKDHRTALEKAFTVVDIDNDGAITFRELSK